VLQCTAVVAAAAHAPVVAYDKDAYLGRSLTFAHAVNEPQLRSDMSRLGVHGAL